MLFTVEKRLKYMPYASAHIREFVDEDGFPEAKWLVSYRTVVIMLGKEGWLQCTGTYSRTTMRHISAFMKEFGNGYTYYDAKKCFENNVELNIYSGEMRRLKK